VEWTEIAAALAESGKYRSLCPETLERVARWAAERHGRTAEAVKAARRKLHQVYGAFGSVDVRKVNDVVRQIPDGASAGDVKSTCTRILSMHSSTRERLPVLERIYAQLAAMLDTPPRSILDLGCGLNAFSLPWMTFAQGAEYRACDIDQGIVACTNALLERLGRAPLARCNDLLVSVPEDDVDVALAFKLLPCLERQEEGSSARLLTGLKARAIVCSFPTRSLGGREKGMAATYEEFMTKLAGELGFTAARAAVGQELLFVLRRA